MKIKTQVSISLTIFAILVVVIIFFAYSSYNQLQDIQKKQQIIDNIEHSAFDLYYLENDYVINGGTIPFEHWNAKYAALTGQLQALTLTDHSQKAVLNQMSDSQMELNESFSNLVAVTSGGQGTGSSGVSQELKEFTASTLEGQTQMLMSRSSELSQLVKAESHDVEQRTVLLISFSIAVLILFVLLNYLLINRSVLKSISALQKGAERIGSGDLDTKIETISNDELGYLSHEFNDMTASLKNTRTLLLTSNSELEQENAKRKLTESDLERKNLELESSNEQLAAAEEELKGQFDALAESEQMIRESEERVRNKLESLLSPEGDIGNLDLADIINVQEIQSMMDDFHALTHIGIAILDINGKILVATGWQDICTKFHRVNPETCANCAESDTLLVSGVEPGTVKRYRCKNNMWDIATPIVIGGTHVGNLFLGQFLFEDESVNDEFFRSQAVRYGFDEPSYLAALDRVPRWNRETVDTVMSFYAKFARMVSTLSHSNITLARTVTERDTTLNSLLKVNQKLNVLSQLTRQDLTTQIFIVNSFLEMAKKQAKGQDGIIKNIESGERAVRSIKEITEFTKDYQNMGEKPPKWQNVKLSFLFGLSHISIGEIRHSLETDNLEIFADPLLEKAFQGILENSVKHGGHVSEIRVSHTATSDWATIVFEDNGVGIPQEKKERIFLRGDGARASVRGLFFVQEILSITGIIIRENGEPGKGTRFEMTVPKGAWRMTGKNT